MRERLLILAVLAGFAGIATYPVSRALATGTQAARPRLATPERQGACVLPAAEMRASHMQLLVEWRDLAVRQGVRSVTMPDGRTWRASLTGTCLQCHDRKDEFCDRCHAYAAVTPECWNCHVIPPPDAGRVFRLAVQAEASAPGDAAGQAAGRDASPRRPSARQTSGRAGGAR